MVTSYSVPLRDFEFVLAWVLPSLAAHAPLQGPARAEMQDVLRAAAQVSETALAPVSRVGDEIGSCFAEGLVKTPPGFSGAFAAIRDQGWFGANGPLAYGGQGLPRALSLAACQMFCAANMALSQIPGLNHFAAKVIERHGSDAQRALWLPRLFHGEVTGTMCLTEPQAGTDLGLVSTRARPLSDGRWALHGQKIFISWGDHDLTPNIVHLVLARAEGAPPGGAGLSLFIVPKLDEAGAANRVTTLGVENKMGMHASPTCSLLFDGAIGSLIGPLGSGLSTVFTMVNEARLAVGMQGIGLADAAYQRAQSYARSRLQGRAPGATGPAPLLAQPDVRRLLLDMRSFVEAGRALTLWIAEVNESTAPAAQGLAALLTPVVKAYLTEQGFAATVAAQQVFGGHGYIEGTGLSQLVRDARLTMIYEGANGVQATDLVARKLPLEGGAVFRAFLQKAEEACRAARENPAGPAVPALLQGLTRALDDLGQSALLLATHGAKAPEAALAGATDFLQLFGQTALGLMWLVMAEAARKAAELGAESADFAAEKALLAQHYAERVLPQTAVHRARIAAGGAAARAFPDAGF